MTERERLRDAATDRDRRFRVPDGVGLVLFVAVGAAVLVGVFGGSRWAARERAPVLYDLYDRQFLPCNPQAGVPADDGSCSCSD
ncbi:hypothetical protein ACFT9J_00345 [Streptomyces anthocyanicus]|uniref:hypothetical protein n=1 Tax=Streptomyces anthocyanicus TaxID=68174 RepID=UPI003637C606